MSRDGLVDAALWCAWAVCLAAVVVGSVNDVSITPVAFPHVDKVVHVASYFALTCLLLLAAVWRPGRGEGPYATAGRAAVAAVILLGVVLEMVQAGMTERQSDVVDAAANAVGAALASLA